MTEAVAVDRLQIGAGDRVLASFTTQTPLHFHDSLDVCAFGISEDSEGQGDVSEALLPLSLQLQPQVHEDDQVGRYLLSVLR